MCRDTVASSPSILLKELLMLLYGVTHRIAVGRPYRAKKLFSKLRPSKIDVDGSMFWTKIAWLPLVPSKLQL
ncbi:hypothetical protein D9M69_615850 [compost metagenome]